MPDNSNQLRSADRPLRVLQIASGDLWAGAEVQFFYLCEQLESNLRVELDVVLLNDGELADRLRAIGIAVSVFDESRLPFRQIFKLLTAHCRRVRPDIIHSHRQKENVLAGLIKLFLRIPSIRTVHGASEFNYTLFSAKNLVSSVDKFIGRFLQRRVVAVSEDLKQKLLELYPEFHLAVVRNGLPLSSRAVEPVVLAQGCINIGTVGRLAEVKRVDIFLRMAAELVRTEEKEAANFRFWVIGDGPLRAEHEALTKQLGIEPIVKFVGHVPSALPYLKALDLLVMCSDHEGTPMTLLEAWQCDLPIVAHDVGGLRELLDQGACGCLVDRHEPSEYAVAVSRVLNDESLKDQYIQLGRERLREHYSAESGSQAYLEIYHQVVGRA